MEKIKVFIKYLLVISFTVSLFNIEKINVFFGETHIHEESEKTKDKPSVLVPNIPKEEKPSSPIVPKTETVSPDSAAKIIVSYDSTINISADNEQTESKDSKPVSPDFPHQEKVYSPEKFYELIQKYSGMFTFTTREPQTSADKIIIEPQNITSAGITTSNETRSSQDKIIIELPKIPSADITTSNEPKASQEKIIVAPPKTPSPDIAPQKTVSTNLPSEPETFTGYLKTENSRDTHTFTLSASCEVNISFTPSEGDKAYYDLCVKESSGHVLTRKMFDSGNLYVDTGRLYLRAGTYTIEVKRGYSWSGKPYRITVNTSHSANTEHESNNTPHTANIIPLNENVRASTGTRNDTDYFTFTLEKPSLILPSLEFRRVMAGRKVYDLKLYELKILDTDIRPFIFRGDATPSRKIKPFVLDAGKYIISVSRIEAEELELGLHEYTIRVEAQELM